jgi:glycosyltransferase involved in cell wall biosynthesis
MKSDHIQCSVVVATKNRLAHLKTLISSIKCQDLDEHSFELIVVDDGSSDGTGAFLAELKHNQIKALFTTGAGTSAARNVGSELARGAILAFTDDDCVPPSNWLSTICHLLHDETLAAVTGSLVNSSLNNIFCVLQADMNHFIVESVTTNPEQPWFGPGGNFACRSSVFRAMGGFDPRLRTGGEDREFIARLILSGNKIRLIPSLEVAHNHPFNFISFLRTFFQRGMASFTLLYVVSKDKHITVPRLSASGYAKMILRVGREHGAFESVKRGCLVFLAQCFALLGVATSWIRYALSIKTKAVPHYGKSTI